MGPEITMSEVTYCALCGVHIFFYFDGYDDDLPVPWTGQVRAGMEAAVSCEGPLLMAGTVWPIVTVPSHKEPPFLTGAGLFGDCLNGDGWGLWANPDPNIPYVECDSFDHLVFYPVDGYWDQNSRGNGPIYLFHEACWRILRCRVVDDPSDKLPAAVARVLFYLLQCTPKDGSGNFLVDHEYGGAGSFRKATISGLYEDTLSEEWSFLLADPTDSTALPVDFSGPAPFCHSPMTVTLVEGSLVTDPFYCLPPELIGRILTQLRSHDMCTLRLASRVVASVTSPNSLSQEFWRSRFAPDMEMEGVFALQPRHRRGAATDWRKVYAFIRGSLKDDTLHPALRNKMRIWKCVGHICSSLETLLGDESRSWQDWAPPLYNFGLEKWTGPSVDSHSSQVFSKGELLLPVSTPVQSPQRISVSFIPFNCRQYVCGLRVRRRLGCDAGATISQVGVNLPATERHFDMDAGDSLESLLVYTIMDGIVGIEFRLRMTESSTFTLRGFGHCHGSNTVAVASLEPPSTRDFRGIGFGFDVRGPACVNPHPLT